MKRKYYLLVLLSFISLNIFAQQNNTKQTNKSGPYIVTLPDTVKLGEIYLDELSDDNGKVQISVLNNGTSPLIIKSVTGCCGTNIEEWPKAPILPGKQGIIKVEFRIEPHPQRISRTVTIESNALNFKVVKVPILGVVVERKMKNEITL